MERNGQLVATAAGAAVLGHPAASVCALLLGWRPRVVRFLLAASS